MPIDISIFRYCEQKGNWFIYYFIVFWIYFHSHKHSSSSLLGMTTYFMRQLQHKEFNQHSHGFQFFTIIDNTWMNSLVNMFLWICLAISLRFIPRSEIAGSPGSLLGFSCILPKCSPGRLHCIHWFSPVVYEGIHLSYTFKYCILSININIHLPNTHKRTPFKVWISSLVKLLSFTLFFFFFLVFFFFWCCCYFLGRSRGIWKLPG